MNDDEYELTSARRFTVDNYAIAEAPRLGWRGWLRWGWRQVTSMRLALILLLFLGIAAIPGSVLPQWPQDAAATRAFITDNPTWGPFLDAIGMLDVFGSAWFTAIYLLLFASLVGCIVPRSIAHGKAMRAQPSAAPSSLKRYEPAEEKVGVALEEALSRAKLALRPSEGMLGAFQGYRVRVDERLSDKRGSTVTIAGEKGHVREFGNLLFHLSLVAVLIAVATGSMLTYRGQAVITEGSTFTNAVVDYDTYEAGRFFDPASLEPFTLRLDGLDSAFYADGRPSHFRANMTLTEPDGSSAPAAIEVNRPLQVAGGKIYLQGNGFAPRLTVHDADGELAFSGAVPFLPQDAVYTSTGVVKVPDVTSGPQLGLAGTLLPTAVETPYAGTVSSWPEPLNPVIVFFVYTGDLGLDEGVPQNVYRLDMTRLEPVVDDSGEPVAVTIAPGETVELPDGLGTVTWVDLPRFIAVDLRADPSLPWLLAASAGAFVGIAISLFGSRRRLWLHLTPARGKGATTLVSGAVLAHAHDSAAARELERVMAAVAGREPRDEESPSED